MIKCQYSAHFCLEGWTAARFHLGSHAPRHVPETRAAADTEGERPMLGLGHTSKRHSAPYDS